MQRELTPEKMELCNRLIDAFTDVLDAHDPMLTFAALGSLIDATAEIGGVPSKNVALALAGLVDMKDYVLKGGKAN